MLLQGCLRAADDPRSSFFLCTSRTLRRRAGFLPTGYPQTYLQRVTPPSTYHRRPRARSGNMAANPDYVAPARNIEHLKVPPHSVEAEQAVLGGLMLSQEAWDKV